MRYPLILISLWSFLIVGHLANKNNKPGKSKFELENEKLEKSLPEFLNGTINNAELLKQENTYKFGDDGGKGKGKKKKKKDGPKLIQVHKKASKELKNMVNKQNDRIKKVFKREQEEQKYRKKVLEGDWKAGTKEFYDQIKFGAGQWCADLATLVKSEKLIPYSAVRNCYWSFKSAGDVRKRTLDAVFGLLQLYVFTYDSLRETGYYVVDILDRIRKMPFGWDWQFQEAVHLSLVPMFDGHLEYIPTCYRQFTFIQPVFLTGVLGPKGETRIYLHSVDKWENVGLKQYEGAEVVNINGKRADVAIQEYADLEYGKSKSPYTRFNKCLAFSYWETMTRSFLFDRGAFARRSKLPDASTVSYEFKLPGQAPVKVDVPWFVSPNPASGKKLIFDDAVSYWKNYCADHAKYVPRRMNLSGEKNHGVSSKDVGKSKMNKVQGIKTKNGKGKHNKKGFHMLFQNRGPSAQEQREQGDKAAKSKESAAKVKAKEAEMRAAVEVMSSDLPYKLVAQGPAFSFFVLDDQDPVVGVLLISTFATGSLDSWTRGLMWGFQEFAKRGVKKVLLDLSNNGSSYLWSKERCRWWQDLLLVHHLGVV
jgi:hypothetical protein